MFVLQDPIQHIWCDRAPPGMYVTVLATRWQHLWYISGNHVLEREVPQIWTVLGHT